MKPSYSQGGGTRPLLGVTIGQALRETAARVPEREALVSVFENRRFTYAQFDAEVDRVARLLLAGGTRKGEHIGLWSTNCVAWVILQFATARIGAVLVNINPAYKRREADYALRQSRCVQLFVGEGFKDTVYAEILREIGELPDLRRVIPVFGEGWDAFLGGPVADEAEFQARQEELDFDDIINIQYTSGTTGFPKGAMLTHHNLLNNGYWVGAKMQFSEQDRLCIPVPFYHCFGMVMGNLNCVSHGAAMIIPAPHFSPLQTLEAVQKERCTALHGVPTMFIAQLEHPRFKEFDLTSLRTGIMAGAPCPVHVMKRVLTEMHCPEILIACGMTETSPVCNMTEVNDPIDLRVGTIGKVMPHQEQKIIDPETGRLLPCGVQGELCYRGYHVMRGYYDQPEATALRIDESGWLRSGDLAVMDENGYVKMTGRCSDMICRGGENIYPREVEDYLYTHPAIAEAAVFGVPDAYYGEDVAAWIRIKDGESLTAEEVRGFCRGKIMDFKIPRYVRFVTEFPTTVTGKLQKYRMREAMAAELGKDA